MDFATQSQQDIHAHSDVIVSQVEIEQLRAGGLDDTQIAQVQKILAGSRQTTQPEQPSVDIKHTLFEQTGVSEEVWREAGMEMLEAILPQELGQTQKLFTLSQPSPNQQILCEIVQRIGIEQLTLTTDFPVTRATFGYSRFTDVPNECQLNSFPRDPYHQGKFPIFVNVVQGDAIIARLDAQRIWQWLEANGQSPSIPANVKDPERARRAYFVQMFNDIPLEHPQLPQQSEAYMVFGLLHTMSHLFVRHASLLCGLNQTSLSEYVLPRALTFALYCTHREGATIGALASLFEDSLMKWLSQIQNDTRRCVYDPVCHKQGGECHACTYLAETSCSFFNRNLGRCFLFGGPHKRLGEIRVGYFDSSLN